MKIFAKNNDGYTVSEIVEIIEKLVPSALQEEWDNSGLIIGFEDKKVNTVLTCLEIDRHIVKEAKEVGAEMIITACPLCKYNLEKNGADIPVVYFTELLAEALGVKEDTNE